MRRPDLQRFSHPLAALDLDCHTYEPASDTEVQYIGNINSIDSPIDTNFRACEIVYCMKLFDRTYNGAHRCLILEHVDFTLEFEIWKPVFRRIGIGEIYDGHFDGAEVSNFVLI